MNLEDLKRPFQPHEILWRVGSVTKDKKKTMALAYMDARHVANRLDEVCGPENWQNRFSHAGQKTCCEIGIYMNSERARTFEGWVWKSDGAGDTGIESEKGAFSDAFKRAATKWGIGRYLYDIKSPWVPINEYKQFTDEAYKMLNNAYRDATWKGPLNGGELKTTFHAFVNHLKEAQTVGDVERLRQANQDVFDQMEQDWHTAFYGGGDVPSIDERIADRMETLAGRE